MYLSTIGTLQHDAHIFYRAISTFIFLPQRLGFLDRVHMTLLIGSPLGGPIIELQTLLLHYKNLVGTFIRQ